MTAVVAMVGLGLGSWVLRALFILMIPAERLPQALRDGLTHLAPAALAALVAVEVAGAAAGLDVAGTVLMLGSLAVAGFVVRLTGSVGLAVTIGLGAALVIDFVPL